MYLWSSCNYRLRTGRNHPDRTKPEFAISFAVTIVTVSNLFCIMEAKRKERVLTDEEQLNQPDRQVLSHWRFREALKIVLSTLSRTSVLLQIHQLKMQLATVKQPQALLMRC